MGSDPAHIDVFISYHQGSSRAVAEAVAAALEARGFRCWYFSRDNRGFYAGGIVRAIAAARVFVLLLSPPASRSFDVLNEVEVACDRLRKHDSLEIIPYHIAGGDNELDLNMLYYIKRLDWIDARSDPTGRPMEDLVSRAVTALGGPPAPAPRSQDRTPPDPLDVAELEGAVLEAPLPFFLPRADHSGDPCAEHFSCLDDGLRDDVPIPYKEILGSGEANAEEYREGSNLTVEHEDWTASVRDRIPGYEIKRALEFDKGRKAHYQPETSPPVLCLSAVTRRALAVDGAWSAALTLRFGQADYYDHRLYREVLSQPGSPDRRAFLAVLRQAWGVTDAIRRPLWGNSGGGVWLVTRDGYLALSYRNPGYLLEEPGKLGYSSSGGYNRFLSRPGGGRTDGTPARNIIKEMGEEIGIPGELVKDGDPVLLNLGVDAARYLIQFSHYWLCPFTRRELVRFRKTAPTAMEQQLFFLPFRRDVIDRFLQTCEFEPGAAWSLMRLRQKFLEGTP